MTAAEIENRRQLAAERLRHWLKNPVVPPSEAARLSGVSRTRVLQLLADGLVAPELRDGQVQIVVKSLASYFAKPARK